MRLRSAGEVFRYSSSGDVKMEFWKPPRFGNFAKYAHAFHWYRNVFCLLRSRFFFLFSFFLFFSLFFSKFWYRMGILPSSQPFLRWIQNQNPFRAVPVYRDPPEDEIPPPEAFPRGRDPMLLCGAFIHAGVREVEGPLYAGVLDPGSNAGFLLYGVRELGFQCGV